MHSDGGGGEEGAGGEGGEVAMRHHHTGASYGEPLHSDGGRKGRCGLDGWQRRCTTVCTFRLCCPARCYPLLPAWPPLLPPDLNIHTSSHTWTSRSLCVSSAEVASSRRRI